MKKLFIVGAGASYDISAKMPLGSDLFKEIKKLKCKIFYQILYLITVKTSITEYFNIDVISRLSQSIIKQYSEDLYNEISRNDIMFFPKEEIIKEFVEKIVKTPLNMWKKMGAYFEDKIIEEVMTFLKKDDILSEMFTSFQLFQYRVDVKDQKNTFDCWIKAIDLIFSPVEFSPNRVMLNSEYVHKDDDINWINTKKYCRDEIESYVKNGLVLSCLAEVHGSVSQSIDSLINFLPSVASYTEEYSNITSLPEISKIASFAKEITSSIIVERQMKVGNTITSVVGWLQILHNMIFANTSENVGNAPNNHSFIIFNYDNLIEASFIFNYNKLYNADNENYDSNVNANSKDIALIFFKDIKKSHIYGSTGMYITGSHDLVDFIGDGLINIVCNIVKQDDQSNNSAKLQELKNNIEENKKWKEKINLIRLDFNQGDIDNWFKKILHTDVIYILGFGFDSWNLRNIGIYDDSFNLTEQARDLKNKTIYVTNFGDLPKTRLVIELIFGVNLFKESYIVDESGKQQSFWRSKDNERGNNVFVSTKPVYRALTEDFL